jgi:hypothetical protein
VIVEHGYPSRHFSLNNPEGPSGSDLPMLLRRAAAEIEAMDLDPFDVLDVTVSCDITDLGPWWCVSVYWSAPAEAEPEPDDEPADGGPGGG